MRNLILGCFGKEKFTHQGELKSILKTGKPESPSNKPVKSIMPTEPDVEYSREALRPTVEHSCEPFRLREPLQPKNIEEIAHEFGVPMKNLESYLKTELPKNVELLDDWKHRKENEKFIDNLYNLYLLSKDIEQCSTNPWLKSMQNFDSFVGQFYPKASNYSKKLLIQSIQFFVNEKIGNYKVVMDNKLSSVYEGIGRWHKLPEEFKSNSKLEFWADKSVIDELYLLKQTKPINKPTLYHGTGSATLGKITTSRAILSAKEALNRGIPIVNGEYVGYIDPKKDTSVTGCSGRLGSVYTLKHNSPLFGYTGSVRWFNEFPVCFGIDIEKQKAYNKKKQKAYNKKNRNDYYDHYTSDCEDGITIGPIVPLENITAVYAPKIYESQVVKWIEKNCSNAVFISMEAAEIAQEQDWWNEWKHQKVDIKPRESSVLSKIRCFK